MSSAQSHLNPRSGWTQTRRTLRSWSCCRCWAPSPRTLPGSTPSSTKPSSSWRTETWSSRRCTTSTTKPTTPTPTTARSRRSSASPRTLPCPHTPSLTTSPRTPTWARPPCPSSPRQTRSSSPSRGSWTSASGGYYILVIVPNCGKMILLYFFKTLFIYFDY